MDELEKQVRRAYRRLGFQRFVRVLGWCWFVALLAALGLIITDCFYPLGPATWGWAARAMGLAGLPRAELAVAAGGWAAAAVLLGLFAAGVWMVLTRRHPLASAMEIDRRFGLKERVSSTLALPAEQRRSEAGRALADDAIHRVRRIDVSTRFSVRPGKQVLLPLLPAMLAVVVVLWISPALLENPVAAKPDTPQVKKQVERSTKALRKRLADRRKKAEDKGLKRAEELFRRLEEGSKQISKGQTQRKKALVKLNDLAKELKQRREQLGGAEAIKRQLEQLKDLDRGPAEKFAKAVAKGDFQQAAEELRKIQEQIANSKLDAKQKEQLAGQLAKMQEKLNKLAEAHQAAREDLQKRVRQMRQGGQFAEADRLQEQLDKLLQQAPQMRQLDDLAEKLGQCAECLRAGELRDAKQSLGEFQAGLQDLQQQLDELQLLDEAMQQLAQAKDQMNCPHCGGFGCAACQGDKPGFGMGRGRGQGDRPEQNTDTDFYNAPEKGKIGKRGVADVVDLVPGPNLKGDVKDQIVEQYDTARTASTDPLTGRRIPRKHRQHALEYFNRFREGQ